MNKLFEVSNLKKSFKHKEVLKDINLNIYQGDVIGLLGLNGEGKSTLIKILLGLVVLDAGQVTRQVDVQSEVGVMLQEIAMPERMKVWEWLEMVRHFASDSESVESVLQKVELTAEKKKYCDTLSGGQQRRLQFATAIIHSPQVLVVDEPTVGMDVLSKKDFWETLTHFSTQHHLTILLISHDMEEVAEFCNRLLILDQGRLLVDEKMEHIKKILEAESSYFLPKDRLTREQLEAMKERSLRETEGELQIASEDMDELLVEYSLPLSLIHRRQKGLREYFMEVLEHESLQ